MIQLRGRARGAEKNRMQGSRQVKPARMLAVTGRFADPSATKPTRILVGLRSFGEDREEDAWPTGRAEGQSARKCIRKGNTRGAGSELRTGLVTQDAGPAEL